MAGRGVVRLGGLLLAIALVASMAGAQLGGGGGPGTPQAPVLRAGTAGPNYECPVALFDDTPFTLTKAGDTCTVTASAVLSPLGPCIGDVNADFCDPTDFSGHTLNLQTATFQWPTTTPFKTIGVWSDDAAVTSGASYGVLYDGGLTASGLFTGFGVTGMTGTFTGSGALAGTTIASGMIFGPTVTNAAGAGGVPNAYGFNHQPVVQASNAIVLGGGQATGFFSQPQATVVGGSTMTGVTLNGMSHLPVMGNGECTCTAGTQVADCGTNGVCSANNVCSAGDANKISCASSATCNTGSGRVCQTPSASSAAVLVANGTGNGTLTNQLGLDCQTLAHGATLNACMRSAITGGCTCTVATQVADCGTGGLCGSGGLCVVGDATKINCTSTSTCNGAGGRSCSTTGRWAYQGTGIAPSALAGGLMLGSGTAAPEGPGFLSFSEVTAGGCGANEYWVQADAAHTLKVCNYGSLVTVPVATDTLVGKATTDILTNKTLDAGDATNVVTIPTKVWMPAASCGGAAGTTAISNWDNQTTNVPPASCITGTTSGSHAAFGVLGFDGATDEYVMTTLSLPEDWTGAIDARVRWLSATGDATKNVAWCVQIVCRADGEALNGTSVAFPAQATGNCVSDANKGTAYQLNDAALTNISAATCAAGEMAFIQVSRDQDETSTRSDTLTASDALLLGVELTIRRAM